MKLGERLCFEFRAVNLNLWSMESRFLDWGGRRLAAYGSLASPVGVKGALYVGVWRPGLGSRDTGAEAAAESGPIEKAERWFFETPVLPVVPWLTALVAAIPDDAGRRSSPSVVERDVLGGEIWGVTAAGSLMASTFCNGGATLTPSTSLDLVAEGVMGGECMGGTRGLWRGDGLPEEVLVL